MALPGIALRIPEGTWILVRIPEGVGREVVAPKKGEGRVGVDARGQLPSPLPCPPGGS